MLKDWTEINGRNGNGADDESIFTKEISKGKFVIVWQSPTGLSGVVLNEGVTPVETVEESVIDAAEDEIYGEDYEVIVGLVDGGVTKMAYIDEFGDIFACDGEAMLFSDEFIEFDADTVPSEFEGAAELFEF